MAREGPFTRISAVVAVLALVVSYVIGSAQLSWWPFEKSAGEQQPREASVVAPSSVSLRPPDSARVSTLPSIVTSQQDPVQFVRGYYRMMPDAASGWQYIGPRLQLRTRESYVRFWAQFSAVEMLNTPVAEANYVTVRIALHYKDGRTPRVERHVLGIVSCDGHLCIDSDELG